MIKLAFIGVPVLASYSPTVPVSAPWPREERGGGTGTAAGAAAGGGATGYGMFQGGSGGNGGNPAGTVPQTGQYSIGGGGGGGGGGYLATSPASIAGAIAGGGALSSGATAYGTAGRCSGRQWWARRRWATLKLYRRRR